MYGKLGDVLASAMSIRDAGEQVHGELEVRVRVKEWGS